MERNLKEALKHRRSYYAIGSKSLISDAEIEEIIDRALAFYFENWEQEMEGTV